jgi:tetratricopeptide (TPR) repeat protein
MNTKCIESRPVLTSRNVKRRTRAVNQVSCQPYKPAGRHGETTTAKRLCYPDYRETSRQHSQIAFEFEAVNAGYAGMASKTLVPNGKLGSRHTYRYIVAQHGSLLGTISKQPSPTMNAPNLHTLDSDVLHHILILCPNLTDLRNLICTHPAIHDAFSGRRRLILRLVYKNQFKMHPLGTYWYLKKADDFITPVEQRDPVAGVAFRECIWPLVEKPIHSKQTLRWATYLLSAYHQAELKNEEMLFARRIMSSILGSPRSFEFEVYGFARAAIRTHLAAGLNEDAVTIQERIRQRIEPRSPEHSRWSKELVASYKKMGYDERIIPLHLENWELYKNTMGPGADVTLEWARAAVGKYKEQGKNEDALQFWQTARRSLDPASTPYIAWSRYMMHMYKRQRQDSEALRVTEEVWRNIQPEVTGYRAWTAQLSDQYESAGRGDDAIAVCESAWRAIDERLKLQPISGEWKYQLRGACLMLAKVYRRHGRLEEADAVEARCSEIR